MWRRNLRVLVNFPGDVLVVVLALCSRSCSCSWQKSEAEEGRLTETGTEGEELVTGDRGS